MEQRKPNPKEKRKQSEKKMQKPGIGLHNSDGGHTHLQ
jgi:hypothetical protein